MSLVVPAVLSYDGTALTMSSASPDTFASKPRVCGDPDSSFEDISDR